MHMSPRAARPGPLVRGDDLNRATTTAPATTILHEEIREAIHACKIRRIGNRAPVLVGQDERGGGQDIEMKRESGARQSEAAGDRSGGKAAGRVTDEQPKDAEPRLLRERCEGIDGVECLHISRTMEI
jgi:hypothetical protein